MRRRRSSRKGTRQQHPGISPGTEFDGDSQRGWLDAAQIRVSSNAGQTVFPPNMPRAALHSARRRARWPGTDNARSPASWHRTDTRAVPVVAVAGLREQPQQTLGQVREEALHGSKTR
jgi:hypothetical protein